DKTVTGVLRVKGCHATRFARKPTRCGNVGNTLSSLVNGRLKKVGVNVAHNVQIVKTAGDKKQTEFHYTIPCQKEHQKALLDSLKDSCKDKELTDTCTHANQPEDDDSSSESSEETTKATPAKVTQKDAPAPTAAHATPAAHVTPKATSKTGKTLKPSKPTAVDCDKDHQVTVKDDKTVTGVLRVKGCHATRFARKPTRCSNVGSTLSSLVNGRLKKLGVNVAHNVQIVKTAGDKKQTEFHYTIPCQKEHQKALLDSLKDSCKDKELTDTCTHANQPEDDDSSSESSEETTKATPAKVTQKDVPEPTAAHATPKATSKTGKTLKPSKPTAVDCDKDHQVSVKDDKTVTGVLRVKGCHATRFARKPTRCGTVGNTLSSLVNGRLKKAGVNVAHNVQIVKTAGDKKQTEFHYTIPCQKEHQKALLDSLKDSCKDKELTDTCTHANQPEDDDSSSESSEETTKATPAKVTQKDAPAPTAAHATPKATTKSGKTLKPSKPTAVDCDKDHQVTVKDDKTVTGVLRVKGCHATRFARKPTRCGNVGNTLSSLVNGRLKK
ncbi:unnamed protein product, partial [Adineta steineri]